jgi:hypothetical protein
MAKVHNTRPKVDTFDRDRLLAAWPDIEFMQTLPNATCFEERVIGEGTRVVDCDSIRKLPSLERLGCVDGPCSSCKPGHRTLAVAVV